MIFIYQMKVIQFLLKAFILKEVIVVPMDVNIVRMVLKSKLC
jgi:hypothetical protein